MAYELSLGDYRESCLVTHMILVYRSGRWSRGLPDACGQEGRMTPEDDLESPVPTMAEMGLDMGSAELAGQSIVDVHRRGVCACGHRVSTHMFRECRGIPRGRRRHETQERTDCLCRDPKPVVIVKDTRSFRGTWLSAQPVHPMTASLLKVGDGSIVAWLVAQPMACEMTFLDEATGKTLTCGRTREHHGVAVRFGYKPGTGRAVSGTYCSDCVPNVNPL